MSLSRDEISDNVYSAVVEYVEGCAGIKLTDEHRSELIETVMEFLTAKGYVNRA